LHKYPYSTTPHLSIIFNLYKAAPPYCELAHSYQRNKMSPTISSKSLLVRVCNLYQLFILLAEWTGRPAAITCRRSREEHNAVELDASLQPTNPLRSARIRCRIRRCTQSNNRGGPVSLGLRHALPTFLVPEILAGHTMTARSSSLWNWCKALLWRTDGVLSAGLSEPTSARNFARSL
jgi:hypothetical protein